MASSASLGKKYWLRGGAQDWGHKKIRESKSVNKDESKKFLDYFFNNYQTLNRRFNF